MGCFKISAPQKPIKTDLPDFETIHGKDEVIGSIPIEGSTGKTLETLISQCFKGFCMSLNLPLLGTKFTIIGANNGLKIDRIKLVENPETLTEKFFYRVKRKIKHDATFTIDKILYETDQKFASYEMEVRYEPEWLEQEGKNVLIFKDDKKVGEARQVNFHENAHVKRRGSKNFNSLEKKIILAGNESKSSFQTISFANMEDNVKDV